MVDESIVGKWVAAVLLSDGGLSAREVSLRALSACIVAIGPLFAILLSVKELSGDVLSLEKVSIAELYNKWYNSSSCS